MSKLLILFAMLAAIPAFVLAQGSTPMPHPDFQVIRQTMQQQQAMHKQFRAKVLAAITPAHRNLLASLVGQLAISASPDPRGVIKKLDAALSSGEKQAILNVAQTFMAQQRAQRQAMMAKFRAANPNFPSPRPMRSGEPKERHTGDAGALLFMLATGGGPGMGNHRFMLERERMGPPGGFRRWPRPSPMPT
jgi:formate dehydrogenase maturation protein FdhE